MKLLFTGLYKLKPFDCNKQRIWRAIRIPSDKTVKFTKGQTVRWWSFGSCTLDMEQLFFRFTDCSPVIFNINTNKAFQICPFSCFPLEGEVLIVPPIQLKVSNVGTLNGVTIVEIEEDPSFPLFYLPLPKQLPNPHTVIPGKLEFDQGENLYSKAQFKDAHAYFTVSAHKGYPPAFTRLGRYCYGKLFGPKDDEKKEYWFGLAKQHKIGLRIIH